MASKMKTQSTIGFALLFVLACQIMVVPMFDLLPSAQGAPGDWWNTSWAYRKAVTIDRTKVAASLFDFPVLIDLTDSDLASKAQADGGDIVFVNGDNTVKLDHQVELFESATGNLVAWVSVQNLSSTVDTVLYMYYGNSLVSNQENPVGVWDSNFGMVLHLSDTSGPCVDSTVNSNDGTVSGVVRGVTGKVSQAYDFDGVSGYVEVPHDSMLAGFTAGFTVSTWFRVDTNTKRMTLLQKYNTAGNQRGWMVEYKNDVGPRSIALLASPNGVSLSWWYTRFTPTVGTWYHLTVVWRSNTAPLFYVNGQLQTTVTGSGAPIASIFNNVGAPLHIGRNTYNSAYYLNGLLDEVQLSNVARSAAWVSTSFNAQSSPSTFYAVGAEETQGARVSLTVNVVGNGVVNKVPNLDSYAYGAIVELTAVADPGWSFSGWSGALSGNANPIQITMDGDKSVTATFTQNEYVLTINIVGSGSVSKNPDQLTYHYGDVVQLTAVPVAGWSFSAWSGDLTSGANPESITIHGNEAVTATFTQGPVYLFADGFESGSTSAWSGVSGTPPVVQSSIKHHGTFAMRAAASARSCYLALSESTVYVRAYFYVDAASASVELMRFTAGTNIVALVKRTSSGALQLGYRSGGSVLYLTSVAVTLPLDSWHCIELRTVVGASGVYSVWLDGVEISAFHVTGVDNNNYGSVTRTYVGCIYSAGAADVYVDCAVVSKTYIGPEGVTHTIIASAGAGGSINPSGAVVVAGGGSQSFTITANTGYVIADVVVDGESKGPVSSWDFTDVQADHTISASFFAIPGPGYFTIVVLPDTQFYSESYPAIFNNQTQWIINNVENMNILFVLHEGDLVNNDATAQWINANASMSLLDGHVPWAVLPGNHDGTNVGTLGENLNSYNTYFPYSRFNGETWYGDAYNSINTNSYVLFSGGYDDYIIFNFQYHPSDAVLAWANTTIAAYPNRRAIVVTHDYLNTDGTRTSEGNHIWNSYVSHHAAQIFLVLCGHNHGEARRQDTVNGDVVYQILADYQSRTNGGDGLLRILEFHPAQDTIYVKTFTPYHSSYETDVDSQFTLDYDMSELVTLTPANPDSTPVVDYRWMDVADQTYSAEFQNTYNYTQATVHVLQNTIGESWTGKMNAQNLKPNFAYQLKLVGMSGTVDNELIGFAGRWWQEEWNGTAWTNGQNLNNKGAGSSPNPNDDTYLARKSIADGTSPTGLHYRYTGYLLFAYFITDNDGDATLYFETGSCFHVLWKTSQRAQTADDGPLKTVTFDPILSLAYDVDYPSSTVSIFGEWERLPMGSVNLAAGSYNCQLFLTEESFHGTGPLEGNWAAAMSTNISFTIG